MEAKNQKLRLMLIGAIVITLLVIGIGKALNTFHWGSSDPGESTTVLIADRYIAAFTVIKPEFARARVFPKELVPPGALQAKNELVSQSGQRIFTSAISIPEGHPLTRALLNDSSQNDTLGSVIQPGKVAVSFEIDKSHGVGGWIKPGDTVAIFGVTPINISGSQAPGKKTQLLFPSVTVVAVDDKRLGQSQDKSSENGSDSPGILDSPSSNGGKIITVIATPAMASTLIEAKEEGNLSVVLRSPGDDISWPEEN